MGRGNQPSKAVVSGLAILACVFATSALAELSPQERLDAIRQSLIDASLQTPTRVQTTTWIDSQGSLRESSSFKNGMEVRGIRVLAYDRDEAGQPKARLQYPSVAPEQVLQKPDPNMVKGALQNINKAFNKVTRFVKDNASPSWDTTADAPACKIKVGENFKHVMSLNLETDPSAHPVFLSAFLPLIQSQWIGNSNTMNTASAISGWRMVNSLPEASMSRGLSAYERALISNRPENLPWSAKLKVRTEQLEAKGLAGIGGGKGNRMLVHLKLQVMGTESQNAGYEDSVSLALEIETSAWSAPKMNLPSISTLQNELQVMRSHAEEWLSCQPINPVVTAVSAQQVEINAGTLAGVKKGDEWLVANPASFPSELMGQNGAPQTLLAKVQSVTPFNAQLVVLAGPAKSAQTDWRAWPTDTLVKEPSVQTKPTVTSPKRASNKPTSHDESADSMARY